MMDYEQDALRVEELLMDIMNNIDEKMKCLDDMRKEVIMFEWDKLDTAKDALIKAQKALKRAHAGYVGGEAYPGEFERIEEDLWR